MSDVSHVYRWDLDKTYLVTDFHSLRGLARAAIEGARDKVNIPGSAALLRSLSRSSADRHPWIAIVSGSPRQMRRTLERKLSIDGVRWDEFHLKDSWGALKRGRLRAVREQVGYKLPLLLRSRMRLPLAAREVLFGDDAEMDGLVYSLFAELLAGRLEPGLLARVMTAVGAYEDAIEETLELAAGLPRVDAVDLIFIHLDALSPPARFTPLGSRVVPVYSHFQAALVLYDNGHLPAQDVLAVSRQVATAPPLPDGRRFDRLENEVQDIVRRGHLSAAAVDRLLHLADHPDIPENLRPGAAAHAALRRARRLVADLGPRSRHRPPAPPEDPDWLALAKEFAR